MRENVLLAASLRELRSVGTLTKCHEESSLLIWRDGRGAKLLSAGDLRRNTIQTMSKIRKQRVGLFDNNEEVEQIEIDEIVYRKSDFKNRPAEYGALKVIIASTKKHGSSCHMFHGRLQDLAMQIYAELKRELPPELFCDCAYFQGCVTKKLSQHKRNVKNPKYSEPLADLTRRKKHRSFDAPLEENEKFSLLETEHDRCQATPREKAELIDDIECLHAILERLPEKHRRVLQMKLDGLSFVEMGSVLGVSDSYAKRLFDKACEQAKVLVPPRIL